MTRIRRTWIARLFAVAVAAVAVDGSSAQAGIIPVSVTVTPEAGNFRWTYAVVLPTDMKLQSGSFFTIYDFGGLMPGTISAPDGWTASVSNTTTPPPGLKPGDSPNLPDITFHYTGSEVLTGQVGLGNFWAVSTVGESGVSEFTAQNPQASTGNIDRNIVETIAPTPPGPPPPPSGVPEPTTLALAGLGLPLIGAARLFRRKK
ncbi:MAG TPA: PEP-CTERM sorting domain-containing protein [Gemmataceae bacterium]|nr:PEP-CTERM sorting domain-containing protein [Gemmataceae bacterium]